MNNCLFKNKSAKWAGRYRIKSVRLKNYDYSQNGLYFVTICTDEQRWFFGKIDNVVMVLNVIGKMANKYWSEISKHFLNVYLDEYIVMPNHVHGVVGIDNNISTAGMTTFVNKQTSVATPTVETPNLGVSTNATKPTNIKIRTNVTKPKTKKPGGHNPQGKSGALGVIINQFKRKCTIENRKIIPHFAWQTRFYDHIIRNEQALNNIRNYIKNNPKNWKNDRNNILN